MTNLGILPAGNWLNSDLNQWLQHKAQLGVKSLSLETWEGEHRDVMSPDEMNICEIK